MDKSIYIGQLNRRIEIQKPVTSHSATGSEVTTWETLYSCWAAVDYVNTGNDEKFIGDQQIATTRAEFTIRYRDGLGEKMRILYNSQIYDIRNFREQGYREYIIISSEKRI